MIKIRFYIFYKVVDMWNEHKDKEKADKIVGKLLEKIYKKIGKNELWIIETPKLNNKLSVKRIRFEKEKKMAKFSWRILTISIKKYLPNMTNYVCDFIFIFSYV